METNTFPVELLTNDNYENWSVKMKNNLLAQGLWDIVEIGLETPKLDDNVVEYEVRRKMNDAALRAIQRSCRKDILDQINNICFAKIAWETLDKMFVENNGKGKQIQIEAHQIIDEGSSSHNPGNMETNTFPLELLTNDNYEGWSEKMKKNLLAQGLWDIVEIGLETPKPDDDVVEYEARRKMNDAALRAIQRSCRKDILDHINNICFAKIAWETLDKMFMENNGNGKQIQIEAHQIIDEGSSSDNPGMLPKYSPIDHIRGAALQMQREVQWFKEVERIIPPSCTDRLNDDGLTPNQLFIKEHQDLRKDGEKWMKDTATSCTVVGALIITIMFAAAFTIPGGNNQDTGLPIFVHDKLFKLFIVTNSLSLFSSSTSVLMFSGIFISRFAEEDFLKSLPNKIIIGLFALFISIVTMMIAFSTALLLMLHGKYWIVVPIISLAGVPIIIFVMMQFRFLIYMLGSTYGSGIFDQKMKLWL